MKLLVDENLPPRLVRDLADLFPDSNHVNTAGLGSAGDPVIWSFAKEHVFAFLTKDKDFAGLSVAWGAPPKVICCKPATVRARKSFESCAPTPFG